MLPVPASDVDVELDGGNGGCWLDDEKVTDVVGVSRGVELPVAKLENVAVVPPDVDSLARVELEIG